MTLAVVTIAHGRHDHLRGQVAGLAAAPVRPDLHVVAVMDDAELPAVAERAWQEASTATDHLPDQQPGQQPGEEPGHPRLVVVTVPRDRRGLPRALARNLGAEAAADHGARDMVFLDVDCIPGPTTVSTYAAALDVSRRSPDVELLQGDVAYLPALPVGEDGWDGWGDRLGSLVDHGVHRPDRVRLGPGDRRVEPDLTRFWSLSFAMTAEHLDRTGGFCTDFVGYGGEDTDFAQRVGERGGSLVWVGGATAYHQHHPAHSPPLQHLDAVVRNAGVFHQRWGWWPMTGWLEQFRELGLAAPDAAGRWRVTR